MPCLRSDLVQRVLGCLRDHPHDDTVDRLTRRLGLVSPDAVEAALAVLHDDHLVNSAGQHWQLSHRGWQLARATEPPPDDD